ncbi:LytR/AlgR family response regulator transcription factor [Algoriphagus formosus]|uniref:Response regulator transcription factor n=1 Tax=Algoriphagus formosus TaxID=2007308 RepID=A0A4R5UXX1_9BACT|nr:LytTR family DNA-binding domain-containing protein [Algoriphagus aquimaris]TDK44169.1 response regulator transcription factor [Algoriphagus aquimaris]
MNCLIVDDEPIAQDILKEYISRVDFLQLVACCNDAQEAFSAIDQNELDLVFLDINMPGIDGITLAKIIPKEVQIIFTTAYREYAVEGFNLEATDYLLKPIPFDRFLKAVNRVREAKPKTALKQDQTEIPGFIFVRQDRKMEKIEIQKIKYVESYADYIKIHLEDRISIVRESISNFEKKLPSSRFIRFHRGYIGNIAAIDSYTNEYIEIDGKALTISRSYKKDVLERLSSFE